MKTENLVLDTWQLGNSFEDVARKAKAIAENKNCTAEFEFNTIICVVNKNTNLDLLFRDYMNGHVMEWKTVGPDCVVEYNASTVSEMTAKKKAQQEKQDEYSREAAKKDKAEREAYEEKTKGVVMEFKDKEAWDSGLAKNTDSYGRCCYDYAEAWAKLMQKEMSEGKTLIECASKTSYELGFFGITGFMYGAAVSVLSHCWIHGEDLRKWHNKEYGVSEDKEGVVNPAVLTFSTP